MEIILWRFEWACEDGDELVKIGMSFANIGINLWRLKRACEDCGMRLLYLDKVVHGGCGTKWRSHHHERLWQCSSIAAAPFNLMCMILWTCSWWCHNSQLLTPPSITLPPTKALFQDHTVKPFSPSPHSSQRSLGKTLSTLWNLSLYN